MIEVEVENFQSIEKASLQIEGFSALVGRSNIGKSAIARAIKYALTGALGSDFVRHGPRCERRARKTKKCRCFARVSITSGDFSLVWQKGDEDNSYKITRGGVTQEYSALDRGEQEFLKPEFQQVEIGDSRDLIQVTNQFKPIFLLDKSGGVVAEVLSDVAKLDDINEAIRLVNRDRKEAMSTRTVREKDVVVLRKAVAAFDGLDAVLARAAAVEAQYARAEEMRQGITLLLKFTDTLRALKVSMEALLAATKPTLPDWVSVDAAGKRYSELKRFHDSVSEKAPVVKRLSGIEKVTLPDTSGVQPALDQLSLMGTWLGRLASVQAALSAVQGVESVPEPSAPAMGDSLDRLAQMEGWLKRLRAIKESITAFDGVSKLPELSPPSLADQVGRVVQLQRMEARYQRLDKEVDSLFVEVEAAARAEQAIVEEFEALGVCPTCEQGIGPGHLHKRAS